GLLNLGWPSFQSRMVTPHICNRSRLLLLGSVLNPIELGCAGGHCPDGVAYDVLIDRFLRRVPWRSSSAMTASIRCKGPPATTLFMVSIRMGHKARSVP